MSASDLSVRRPGYTLIEVVVAVAIAATVVAVSAPAFIRSIERAQERSTVGEFILAMQDLRAEAVLDTRNLDSGTLRTRLGETLPEGWSLNLPDGFILSRGGFCTGGTIQLETPRARIVELEVEPDTPCTLRAAGGA